jgi:hypothetical protein
MKPGKVGDSKPRSTKITRSYFFSVYHHPKPIGIRYPLNLPYPSDSAMWHPISIMLSNLS